MRLAGRWLGMLVAVAGLSLAGACGGSAQPGNGNDAGTGSGGGGGGLDAGSDGGTGGSDAGPDAGPDGGTGGLDAGPDGGTGGQDGGMSGTDAGTLQAFNFPTSNPDWKFYGPKSGGPQDVFDVTMDEGGNLWVAGGSEGLFLMRANGSGGLTGTFEKFGLAEGLHPYGWVNGETAQAMGVPDGSPADTHPDLSATPVISVAGGPAGTVFVGYQGKPTCEYAWAGDQWTPPAQWGDASVYKSGDADRVTLSGSGISVVHYDIFTGPGVVGAEIKGREKICSVYRIAWDKATNSVWFGGNHGFAVAKANASNVPTCNGEPGCTPVWEHSHPAISGCSVDYDLATGNCPSTRTAWLTDGYYGVAVDPSNHDMWLGGTNRTTKFHSATKGDYDAAAGDTEGAPGPCSTVTGMCDRWDLWPDQVPEWDAQHGIIYVSPLMRSTPGASKPDYALDDAVSGIAGMSDGTAWVGSFAHGLIHIDSAGSRLADATAKLLTKYVSGIAYDPAGGGSIWAGMQWGPGISRLDLATGAVTNYSYGTFDSQNTLGDKLFNAAVANIQSFGSGSGRKMVAGFHKFTMKDPVSGQQVEYAGAVAVYTGR